jgi:hypothetical protein
VVMAADHATVDEIAMCAHAARVAAGEVEEGGTVVDKQVVGAGDEVVTTRNDRRLVTNAGAWVRNGDRWRVVARRADGSLLLGSLDGRGKVSVPGDYVRDNVALAYAVTVHKAQGLTTDEAVLVVDEATSAEHLYVGLTRGRQQNLACVVCEPVDDGHRRLPAPSAHDVLTAALGRTGSRGSATEAFRAGLAHAAETGTMRAVLAEVLRRIDALAGPDRSQEIERLGQKVARHANDTAGVGEAERFRNLVVAQQARSDWLNDHPEVVAYLTNLARRLQKTTEVYTIGGVAPPDAYSSGSPQPGLDI